MRGGMNSGPGAIRPADLKALLILSQSFWIFGPRDGLCLGGFGMKLSIS
jgi:hypothetical protein